MGVDTGEWIVGLRSNDEEVVDLLRRGLAPIRVDGIDVFPNLSLRRGADGGRNRELHRLYRRGVSVMRTASLGRLVRSAVRHLDGFMDPPSGLLPLRADVLFGDRGAVLVYGTVVTERIAERRLTRLGWRSADGLRALLDPVTPDVVVQEPRLCLTPEVAAEVEARWPREPEEDVVAPGRYPVRGVILLGTRPDHLRVASPARRLASLVSLLDTTGHPARAVDVEAIGRLDTHAEVVRALGYETDELLDILRALAR